MDLRRTLAELVAIDTVSSRPNGPAVDYLERALAGLGFRVRRLRYQDEAGVAKENLLAASTFEGRPGLALVGHTDTVPYDPAWAQALTLEESEGALFGRGACDTKGFIACALAAAARVDLAKLRAPLALLFTADEEVGCLGAKHVAEARAFFPEHAIVGEPTGLTPVRAHKGYCIARVEIMGREGHSAYPALGASANLSAGHLLTRIDALAQSLEQQRHPAFDPPYTTLNVGILRGGEAPNVIPGSCRLVVEWRPVPGEAPTRVLDLLRAAGHEVARARGVGVAVKGVRLDPGIESPENGALVSFLSTATGKPAATVSYHTEAPQLAALGAQVAVFGPGDIAQAHKTGEHVPIADLQRCADVLGRAIARFCG